MVQGFVICGGSMRINMLFTEGVSGVNASPVIPKNTPWFVLEVKLG